MEEGTKEYLKGYEEGFFAAMKLCWALAEHLLIAVPNSAKDDVQAFIKKLSS